MTEKKYKIVESSDGKTLDEYWEIEKARRIKQYSFLKEEMPKKPFDRIIRASKTDFILSIKALLGGGGK